MSDVASLTIQSHRGPYAVAFDRNPFVEIKQVSPRACFIIDAKVARIYAAELDLAIRGRPVVEIEATERNKSLERCPDHIDRLLSAGVKRRDLLVAIGGGIIQDIVCFIASVLFRGLAWEFVPTTLLAQADSCIGSKSSINVGHVKNAVGTFLPPQRVVLSTLFIDTLERREVRSGIGEMLKVHAIDGPTSFNEIAADYDRLFTDRLILGNFIRRSLEIKKRLIEVDEFDLQERQILNYGHSFGHALESATDFAVPHGIAVTIGMDMANFVAVRLGYLSEEEYRRRTKVLRKNCDEYWNVDVPFEAFYAALAKDKKNEGSNLTLILPDASTMPHKISTRNDSAFRQMCNEYLSVARVL